jgi:hypothetical protein
MEHWWKDNDKESSYKTHISANAHHKLHKKCPKLKPCLCQDRLMATTQSPTWTSNAGMIPFLLKKNKKKKNLLHISWQLQEAQLGAQNKSFTHNNR